MLADEPTGALDAENSERVFQILLDLRKQEKAIVFVTHNMELAKRCDTVYTMKDGCIAGIHSNSLFYHIRLTIDSRYYAIQYQILVIP